MRRTSSRRSSILKPPRGSLRAPDLDLDGLPFDDEDGYTQPSNRRVSFSRISKVQEFDPTIANLAQCMYQETVNIEEGEDVNKLSVSVYEENIETSSLDQNRRRRSGQFKKDNYGSDLSDFCRDLDVTKDNSSMDNSVYPMDKTADLYNLTMGDWERQSVASGMVNIHQSAFEDKKRMYADIESPTKIGPKRIKVKSTSQVKFNRTFGTEMDMTVTFGGIEDCELKRETSCFGMEMTETVGKILTDRTNEGQKDDSLNLNLPGENVYLEENDSLLSKLNCMGIDTPVSTTKELNVFKGNPVFSVKNVNPNTDMDETETHGKLEIQSMPPKGCVFEENSMHKENIHSEMLLKKGQKINHDLFLGETSVRDRSVLHSKRENVWEGKTPKSSGKMNYSVQDDTIVCPDDMDFTVPLGGQVLPTKLERTVEGETSARTTSKNPAFNCSSQSQNFPNLQQDHSNTFSIPKGKKSISSMFEHNNEANFETVRDKNVYLGNIQENKYRENQETDINDISGLELTSHGKLIHYNMPEEDEHINDSEKENACNQRSQTNEKILSDTVHQSSMNSTKNAGKSNDEGQSCLNMSGGKLNQTFPDNGEMEFTVPLGKLLELTRVNENAKRLEETNQETDGMDLIVPQRKLFQFKPSHISENVEQLEVSSQQIDRILSNSGDQSCVNSTKNAVHSNNDGQSPLGGNRSQLNQTFPETDGMELTVPLGKLLDLAPCNNVNESIPKHEEVNPKVDGLESSVHHSTLFQVEPEAAKTKDVPSVVVEDNNVTLSRGSFFRKSSYSFSESNVSRREENMPNASAQENGGIGYGQLLSFCSETIRGEHEKETSISSKIGEASVHRPEDNHCPKNKALEEKAPQENAVPNFYPVNKKLHVHPVSESFISRSTLTVIVENSVGSEISGDLSNAQMEMSSKSSSLQNPVCSEQELSDQNQIRRVDLKSVLPNNAVEENTLGIDEKEGSGEISEPNIPEEANRLAEVEENMAIEENMLVPEKKTEESKCSDHSVKEITCNESRGSKRENPFQYSIGNCKKGIIERLSVPEEESVSEPKETQPIVSDVVIEEQTNEEEAVEKRNSQPGNVLSIVPKRDSSDICIEEISEQSFLHSTLISKDFDLEEWMKEETSKKWCPWKIRKLNENQWSFYVLYGAAKLTLWLKSDTSDSKSRSLDHIELESLMDVGNQDCDYLIVKLFLERCSPTILESLIQTTDQLPDLLEFICKEIKILDNLDKQTTRLFKYYPVIFKDNGFFFSCGSKILMKLFYVIVNLSGWKDGCIDANSVKVINKIGNTREKDIQDILKTIKKDDNYLTEFYKEVKSFVKMLESLKERK